MGDRGSKYSFRRTVEEKVNEFGKSRQRVLFANISSATGEYEMHT